MSANTKILKDATARFAVDKLRQMPVSKPVQDLFIVKTANECIRDAKTKPIPQMLLGELWHEGELGILFSDTNAGKSILAVQTADAITFDQPTLGLAKDAPQQKAVYLDFEMADKQFQKRYSIDFEQDYTFSPCLYRVELNPDFDDYQRFEEALVAGLETALATTGAKILLVDNVTFLRAQATDTAKEALPLMRMLKKLKSKHHLSILVLAHTPKRDSSRPLTLNDLAGSRQLANFADSIFAIGVSSQDESFRYLKQLKARACPIAYGEENVLVCQITKPSNFLQFDFIEFGSERDHLRAQSAEETNALADNIITLKQQQPTLSNAEIARQFNTNPMRVGRVFKRHKNP